MQFHTNTTVPWTVWQVSTVKKRTVSGVPGLPYHGPGEAHALQEDLAVGKGIVNVAESGSSYVFGHGTGTCKALGDMANEANETGNRPFVAYGDVPMPVIECCVAVIKMRRPCPIRSCNLGRHSRWLDDTRASRFRGGINKLGSVAFCKACTVHAPHRGVLPRCCWNLSQQSLDLSAESRSQYHPIRAC